MGVFLSFKLLLTYCTVCYKLSMSIMLTIFDVSIKETRFYGLCFELVPQQMGQNKKKYIDNRVYGSLCFELLPQQMSQGKKKYMELCQYANKYTQVVLETLS